MCVSTKLRLLQLTLSRTYLFKCRKKPGFILGVAYKFGMIVLGPIWPNTLTVCKSIQYKAVPVWNKDRQTDTFLIPLRLWLVAHYFKWALTNVNYKDLTVGLKAVLCHLSTHLISLSGHFAIVNWS